MPSVVEHEPTKLDWKTREFVETLPVNSIVLLDGDFEPYVHRPDGWRHPSRMGGLLPLSARPQGQNRYLVLFVPEPGFPGVGEEVTKLQLRYAPEATVLLDADGDAAQVSYPFSRGEPYFTGPAFVDPEEGYDVERFWKNAKQPVKIFWMPEQKG